MPNSKIKWPRQRGLSDRRKPKSHHRRSWHSRGLLRLLLCMGFHLLLCHRPRLLLERTNLAHHLFALTLHFLGLALQVLILGLNPLELLADLFIALALALATLPFGLFGGADSFRAISSSMHAAQVLVQVFLAREAFSVMALAVHVRAVELLSRTAMFVVDLTLVAQEAAGVCEAWEFRTARDGAFVGTVVLIHVLSENAN